MIDSPMEDKLTSQPLDGQLKNSSKNLLGSRWYSKLKKDVSQLNSDSESSDLSYHVI